MHVAFNLLLAMPPGHFKIVVGLNGNPEFGRHVEPPPELQRHFRTDTPLGVIGEAAQTAGPAGVIGKLENGPAFSGCRESLAFVEFHRDIAN